MTRTTGTRESLPTTGRTPIRVVAATLGRMASALVTTARAPRTGTASAARRTSRAVRDCCAGFLSHRSVQVVLVALIIFLGWVGWSVGQALMAPGNGTVSTRLAEWARDHYLGPVVTLGEWLTYQAPKVGGKPQFSLTAPTTGSGGAAPKRGALTHSDCSRPAQLARRDTPGR